MDPSAGEIVNGGGAMLANSKRRPVAGELRRRRERNLLADFRSNVSAESQGRMQTARLHHMTDDPGVKDMVKFLSPATPTTRTCGSPRSELRADGYEDVVAPNALLDEEHARALHHLWPLSDGADGRQGPVGARDGPDGRHELGFLADPRPLGSAQAGPPPDPKLYATYDGRMGEPQSAQLGTEKGGDG